MQRKYNIFRDYLKQRSLIRRNFNAIEYENTRHVHVIKFKERELIAIIKTLSANLASNYQLDHYFWAEILYLPFSLYTVLY